MKKRLGQLEQQPFAFVQPCLPSRMLITGDHPDKCCETDTRSIISIIGVGQEKL